MRGRTIRAGSRPGRGEEGMAEISRLQALKRYFGTETQPVTVAELKELTREDRAELAEGAAKELGMELEPPKR